MSLGNVLVIGWFESYIVQCKLGLKVCNLTKVQCYW
jgi:hypothetical protein